MVYADLECLLEKIHSCQNNPEKSFAEKKSRHTSSGYSLFINFSFDAAKNKLVWKRLYGKVLQRFKRACSEITSYEKKRNNTAN